MQRSRAASAMEPSRQAIIVYCIMLILVCYCTL